jgi:hypothetical protein
MYSITEPASDQSTVAERMNSVTAALHGGRLRSPGTAGEVLIRTSDNAVGDIECEQLHERAA